MARFLVFFFLLCCGTHAFSQTEIKGTLIDSAHNNVLRSATVSIYQKGVKTVDKVVLTDRFGRFVVEGLPAEKPLLAEFTFQGFEKVVREFQLDRNQRLDWGRINMTMRSEEIETVEILPPVRMNGDTIEFNADAFQLDSNAVAEGLLHNLPGIVVWGDGKITYNGQEIPNVLVNGKPFFGTDKSIALQNVAKDAVEKVQVYDRRSQEEQLRSPYERQYEMNVVLKDGKERMYFGNVTAGGGTDKRYEGHLNFNYANRQAQATAAYSLNNTNKNLNNIDQLLRNTTFKGAAIRSDFDSDFLRSGITQQQVLGGRYQYDFLATSQPNRKNILVGSVLSNRNKTSEQDASTTQVISENAKDMNMRYGTRQTDRDQQANGGNIQYDYNGKLGERTLTMGSSLGLRQQQTDGRSNSATQYDYVNNQSLNEIMGLNNNDSRNLNLDANLSFGTKIDPNVTYINMKNPHSLLDRIGIDLRLKLDIGDENSFSNNHSQFRNFLDPDLNGTTNRIYDRSANHNNYDVGVTLKFSRFTLDHDLKYRDMHTDDRVQDLQNEMLTENDMLSHRSDFRQWIYTPALGYSKMLYRRNLTGRMEKWVNTSVKLGIRLYNEKNSSTLDFRNLEQHFVTILPEIGVNQYYIKMNRYIQRSGLTYYYDEEYPQLEQLRPFYDDINSSYRYFGAEQLDKVKRHQLVGTFSYNQQKQHGYTMSFNARYTLYRDGLGDSIVNSDSQQEHYTVQIARPMHVLALTLNINKSILLQKEQTLGLKFTGNMNWGNKFQYLNTQE